MVKDAVAHVDTETGTFLNETVNAADSSCYDNVDVVERTVTPSGSARADALFNTNDTQMLSVVQYEDGIYGGVDRKYGS